MTRVVFLVSIGNWSVSQPRSGLPVLESTEPSIPKLVHTEAEREKRHSQQGIQTKKLILKPNEN